MHKRLKVIGLAQAKKLQGNYNIVQGFKKWFKILLGDISYTMLPVLSCSKLTVLDHVINPPPFTDLLVRQDF